MPNPNWPAHNIAIAAVASMKKHARKKADFYPTPADATQGLLNVNPPPFDNEVIWEPACGRGAVSRVLLANGYAVASSDLRHTGYGRGGVDFLKTNAGAKRIITNPPFDQAEAFIRHALEVCEVEYLALLLKSNFWHAKKRLQLKIDHPPTGEHAVTWRIAFLEKERGKSPLMDCTWFVWDRNNSDLSTAPIPRPTEYPDISRDSLRVLYGDLSQVAERLIGA